MLDSKSDYWFRFKDKNWNEERVSIRDTDITGDLLCQRTTGDKRMRLKDILYIRQMASIFGANYASWYANEAVDARRVAHRLLRPSDGCVFTSEERNYTRHHDHGSYSEHTSPYKVTFLNANTTIQDGLVSMDSNAFGGSTYWIEDIGLDAKIPMLDLPAWDGSKPMSKAIILQIYREILLKRYKFILTGWKEKSSDFRGKDCLCYGTEGYVGEGVKTSSVYDSTTREYHIESKNLSWTTTKDTNDKPTFTGFDSGSYRSSFYKSLEYPVKIDDTHTKQEVYLTDKTTKALCKFRVPEGTTSAIAAMRFDVDYRPAGGTLTDETFHAFIHGTVSNGIATFDAMSVIDSLKQQVGWSDSYIGTQYDDRDGAPRIYISNPDCEAIIADIDFKFYLD